ncbi:MAG TPA: helix-turn-helix transcriptional regulator [Cryomorphaceae bacterium]|nr:helix-turn-helix transcriptional regulator [Cryomorphaceae bacterium]
MKKISMIVEKTATGFSAYAKNDLIFTTGSSIPELINNTYEATDLFLEENAANEIEVNFEIDFKQFFQYYKVLNAKFLAEKIGMNPSLLSQYAQGRKKPSPKQTEKILKGIHQIGQELSGLNLLQKA